MSKLIGMTLLLIGMASFAFAQAAPGPEIDPSTGAAAIALLSGGVMIFRARRRK